MRLFHLQSTANFRPHADVPTDPERPNESGFVSPCFDQGFLMSLTRALQLALIESMGRARRWAGRLVAHKLLNVNILCFVLGGVRPCT